MTEETTKQQIEKALARGPKPTHVQRCEMLASLASWAGVAIHRGANEKARQPEGGRAAKE